MTLASAGAKSFALGLLLLGVASAASGQFLPGLQPASISPNAAINVATLNGILLAALSGALFTIRFRKPAASLLATYFAAWILAAHVPQLLFEPFDITRFVSLAEMATMSCILVLLALGQNGRSKAAAKAGGIVYGVTLLLFGGVHFQYHDFIAAMIPSWIPFAALWPWFTGSVNLAVGICFLTGNKAYVGGALLGAMYASWVPIVHVPRVLAEPGNMEEYTALALAVTLAGAAWMVAGSRQGRASDPVASIARASRRFVQQLSSRETAR